VEEPQASVDGPTVLSTFSGAGGLDLGLEYAGFRNVGCLETDEHARRTLQLNRPGWKLLEPADVVEAGRQLRPSAVGLRPRELDLLAGGPPCQPFSKAAQWSSGARVGMADNRGQAVLGMLDLLEAFLPRALLIENVAGFLRGPVNAAAIIDARLEEINDRRETRYRLSHDVIDASAYGVPQRRQRAIALAFRDGVAPILPDPTHLHEPITAWDALHDVAPGHKPEVLGGYGDLLPSIPEGGNYLWLTDRGGGENLFGYRTRYWSFLLKLARDKPAWTLAASPGPSTGPFHWDNRPLTVREMLRLQSFPIAWNLAGDRRAQTRLAGNATPPLLAEVMGRLLHAQLRPVTAKNLPEHPRLRIERGPRPPAPRPPCPVPARHRGRIGTHEPHRGTGMGPSPRELAGGSR
jgi:DNA (cytosine-5)-methyltransferase 1